MLGIQNPFFVWSQVDQVWRAPFVNLTAYGAAVRAQSILTAVQFGIHRPPSGGVWSGPYHVPSHGSVRSQVPGVKASWTTNTWLA